jgi:hypothetical protein
MKAPASGHPSGERQHLHLQTASLITENEIEEKDMASQRQGEDRRKRLARADETDGLSVVWRKSTHSNHQSACVEVGDLDRDSIGFRDSKDPEGPVLIFPRGAVRSFLAAVADGEFGGRR